MVGSNVLENAPFGFVNVISWKLLGGISPNLAFFSPSLFAFLYFKFLEWDGNRGLWPASIILIGLDWIFGLRESKDELVRFWRLWGQSQGYSKVISEKIVITYWLEVSQSHLRSRSGLGQGQGRFKVKYFSELLQWQRHACRSFDIEVSFG